MPGHNHLKHLGLVLPCIPLSISKSNIITFHWEGGGGGGGGGWGVLKCENGDIIIISVILHFYTFDFRKP